MSVFNPTLETEIRYEQPVQAPRQFSPVAALADTATQALKVFESSKPTQASLNQAMVNQFGDALGRSFDIQQGRDNGKLTSSEVTELKTFARKFIESSPKAIPEGQRQAYEALTGESWDAVSFKSNEFYEKEQLLQSDLGRTLVASTKILNSEATSEQINEIVLNSMAEVNILKQQKALQDSRVAMGLPVDAGPVVESLRTDFSLLSASFSEFIKDGIVTQDEINSASTSVRALISGQYSQYEGNAQVKAVTDQMFGLVEDLRKFDTDANTLDAIHIALNEAEFNPFTISTIRAMIKENPMEFKNSILGTFEEKGKTWVDGLSKIMSSSPQENIELVDIFSRPPELPDTSGDKPAYLTIPSVKDNPEEYKQVLEGLGAVTSSTSKQKVLNNEDVRNTWLNSVNLLSSLVASQSDEYIMGDKLLSKFSNNQLVSTLESIYQVDGDNAAQTNDALQNALNSEYLRQKMELDQRLSSGDEPYFMVDGDKLVLNLDFLRSKMGDVPQGNRRMAAIEATNARIEQVGGLEQFQKLPQSRRNEILAGSNLERILDTRFGTTLKLFNNLKMIDKKRGLLLELEKRYPAATQAFRGVQGDPELDAFAQEALSSVMNDDRIFSQTLDSLGPDQPQASEATSTSGVAPPSTEVGPTSPLGDVEVPSQEMPLVLPAEEVPFKKIEGVAPTRDLLIDSVFNAEGGYSTDKKDQGNYLNGKFIGTNHGISAPILADYLGREPTVEEMKNLTKDKAKEIAANRYYDRFKIGTLPSDVQEIVFHGVYMSESRAVRAMQNILGLTPDGILGPNTERAIQEAAFSKEDFKDAFLQELEFGTSKINPRTNEPYSKPSTTWGSHGKGWTNRYTELTK